MQDALKGARHIMAEIINEDPGSREKMRELYFQKGFIQSRVASGKEAEGAKALIDRDDDSATVLDHGTGIVVGTLTRGQAAAMDPDKYRQLLTTRDRAVESGPVSIDIQRKAILAAAGTGEKSKVGILCAGRSCLVGMARFSPVGGRWR